MQHIREHDVHPQAPNLMRQAECVFEMSRKANCGNYEDVEMLPLVRWAAGQRPGVFVELGAYDGCEGSKTWLLERCFGWTGILIEAQPQLFERLRNSSRIAHKVWAAVCQRGKTVHMPVIEEGTIPSAFAALEYTTQSYLKLWQTALPMTTKAVERNSTSRITIADMRTVEVPCRPMTDILEEAGHTEADFISIDVQGAEEVVLSTSNLGSVHGRPTSFKVVLVEAERTDRAKNERVRQQLTRAGLRQIPHPYQIQHTPGGASFNDLFVRPELSAPRTWGHSLYPRGGVWGSPWYPMRNHTREFDVRKRFFEGVEVMIKP